MPYEFLVEDGVEFVATQYGPKRVFTVPLSEEREVDVREYTPQEFIALGKVVRLDSAMAGWETVMRALEASIVRVDGKPVEYLDLLNSLRERFSMREIMIIRSVWERVHMPAPELVEWLPTMRPEKTPNGVVYRVEVSDERIVEFREVTIPVFEQVLRLSPPDDPMTMSVIGLSHSLVADRGEVFEKQPVPEEDLLNRFRLAELLALRAAWEAVHMPSEEDMERVKEVGG